MGPASGRDVNSSGKRTGTFMPALASAERRSSTADASAEQNTNDAIGAVMRCPSKQTLYEGQLGRRKSDQRGPGNRSAKLDEIPHLFLIGGADSSADSAKSIPWACR